MKLGLCYKLATFVRIIYTFMSSLPFAYNSLYSYLNSCLRQVDAHCKVLAHKHIRVVRLSKGRFQLL